MVLHRPWDVQVHLPPAGPEGPGARTAPQAGQAKLMVGRFRDLVQHPNQPRSMATEAPDEDDEEAIAICHHTHPPSPFLHLHVHPTHLNTSPGDSAG